VLEAEKQRQAVLAEEARQKEDEASLTNALNEEQEELSLEQANSDQSEIMRYVSAIRSQIERSWTTPPSARRNDKLRLRVQLLPSGEVAVVTIAKSSGNTALDRSAEQAVFRAQPFMVPKSNRLFEKMRVINIDMSSENLRW
jgi:colicin import membrane protein